MLRAGAGGQHGWVERFLRIFGIGLFVPLGAACRAGRPPRVSGSVRRAIRWRQLAVRNGTAAAKPQGGDHRSGRIEAEADYLLALLEEVDDITLHEMQRQQAAERGLRVGIGTLWRFFDRRGFASSKR